VSTESPTPEELQHMLEQTKQYGGRIDQDKSNPLSAYMRQPQIYIKLPSEGKFWKEGSLDYPKSGELPVLSMSTKDELILKSPDALMNGQGVVDVINHCMPNINDAWAMPITDVDTVLIAIRIASYGEEMGYQSTCPKCEAVNEYQVDLKLFLNQKTNISGYDQEIEYKGLKIKIKPQDYRSTNTSNIDQFEQQRMMNVVDSSELSEEEKLKKFNEIFRRMTTLTVRNISGVIDYISAPDGARVNNREYIDEFVENSDRQIFDILQKHQDTINKGMPDKSISTTCPECQHDYTVPFTFDQANFFASAS
jgi:hypothetical protein